MVLGVEESTRTCRTKEDNDIQISVYDDTNIKPILFYDGTQPLSIHSCW